MKKLFGLLTLAPLALSACGGLDQYQIIVDNTLKASFGLSDINHCDSFREIILVDECREGNIEYKAMIEEGIGVEVNMGEWKTYDVTEDGIRQVDAHIAITVTTDEISVTAESDIEYYLKKIENKWIIDWVVQTTLA